MTSPLDAGVAGVLSPDEVAAMIERRLTGNATVRASVGTSVLAPRAPHEAPSAPELGPIAELEAAEAESRSAATDAANLAISIANALEAAEAELESVRSSSGDPAASAAVRARIASLRDDLAEADVLRARREGEHAAAAARLGQGRERDRAAALDAELAGLHGERAEAHAALDEAVEAVYAAQERIADVERRAGELVRARNGMSEPYWLGPTTSVGGRREPQRDWVPGGLRFDRGLVPSIAPEAVGRRRRFLLGL